ncbi:molybdopterin molybdotransferase MoeA [Streptomyces abikoensis]|uniref:molybdopterin molybdotransferase MoeA n=1 Tax=Streptomyces abikoensis TaxID=97398 RepID=UPI003683AEE2
MVSTDAESVDPPGSAAAPVDAASARRGAAAASPDAGPATPADPAPADPTPADPDPAPGAPAPEEPAPRAPKSHPAHPPATPWDVARNVAGWAAVGRKEAKTRVVPLGEALGQTLAGALVALTDLPSFDTSAMDGWAVAGPGPWRLPGSGSHPGILAGQGGDVRLGDGEAVAIATGARVPPGATAVLRSEHGVVRAHGELYADRHLTQGQDVRPRGQECREGDELLPAGVVVTPAVVGLAAASGYDELPVVPRPRVEVLVLGDELLREGLPHDGRIRDALGPMLGPWLSALGADVVATRRLGDDASALRAALEASDADLVLTTGGTAAGPVDHVRPTLRLLGAEPLVDGVAVRPGHPMLLARLASGRHLVGLPGNPLAAVAGLLTLAEPLLRALAGRPARRPCRAPLTEDVPGHATSTRLVPVVRTPDGYARPVRFHGPAMLRGLAAADALAVVPPGGPGPEGEAELLALPWEGDR